jgi:hypothetical protein
LTGNHYSRVWLACIAIVACFVGGKPGAAQSEAFTQAQSAAVARNPTGVTIALQTPNNRTEFHWGEEIPLTAEFRSTDPQWFYAPTLRFGRPPGGLVFDSEIGISHDMPVDFFFYSGPPAPRAIRLKDAPQKTNFFVNHEVRLVNPGVYRFYLSSYLVDAKSAAGEARVVGNTPSYLAVSNVITIRVLPRDLVWEQAQFRKAVKEIELSDSAYKDGDNKHAPGSALDSLICLGTKEAARVLLQRMASGDEPGWSDNDGFACEYGLMRFVDRNWILQEMRRDMTAPEYAVSIDFLDTMGEICYMNSHSIRTVHDNWMALPELWNTVASAAPQKQSGRTRAITVYSFAEFYLRAKANGYTNPSIEAYMPTLRKLLISSFSDLPCQPQEWMLLDRWKWIKGADLLPVLKREQDENPFLFAERAYPHLMTSRIAQLEAPAVTP